LVIAKTSLLQFLELEIDPPLSAEGWEKGYTFVEFMAATAILGFLGASILGASAAIA